MVRDETWDYIIVGGGSAGSVLAARLSQVPHFRVLLLEAGGHDALPQIRIPGLMEPVIIGTKLNWHYAGEPDSTLRGRRFTWAAGRVLGGSSSINGMVYGRGLPADYATWVAAGNPGWDWENMLPVFCGMETWSGTPHPARGIRGPLLVRPFFETNVACRAAMDSIVAAGVPFVDDYSTGISEGTGFTQATQRWGLRHSAVDAYLRPARHRRNLRVLTHSRVERLCIESSACTGVTYTRKGRRYKARAEREVIVAAGAIGTPKLLLLSGVGDPASIEPFDIKVAHDLPGVGNGMNDHVNVKLSAFVDTPTYNTQLRWPTAARYAIECLVRGTGPATSPANHVQAFVKTDPALTTADVQIRLMDLGFGTAAQMRRDGITAVVSLCHPLARGAVRLASNNAAAAPRIAMSMLEHDEDIMRLLRSCRFAQAALQRVRSACVYAPQPSIVSDLEWLEFFVRRPGSTGTRPAPAAWARTRRMMLSMPRCVCMVWTG
jgi:choline dehydrogenase